MSTGDTVTAPLCRDVDQAPLRGPVGRRAPTVFAALLALLACGFALAACATPAPAPGVVVARLGETARLGDLRVRPLAVVEDSRCPRDVTCVWAGRLRLRVRIEGVTDEPVLTLGEAYPLRAGTLTLVSAMPERWQTPPSGAERGPANRFGFRSD